MWLVLPGWRRPPLPATCLREWLTHRTLPPALCSAGENRAKLPPAQTLRFALPTLFGLHSKGSLAATLLWAGLPSLPQASTMPWDMCWGMCNKY